MIKQTVYFIILLTVCCLVCLANETPVLPHPGTADPDGKLVFALGGEVSVINPILSSDTASSAIEGPLFSSLVTVNEDLEFVPDLAKSWEVSGDGLTWTFRLRRDVKWHDGIGFTAEDVKFTFDTIMDPGVNSVRRSNYMINGKPIRFYIQDRYTVKVILPEPFSPLLASMTMGIIPKHLLVGREHDMSFFSRKPVGTGPFKLKEWKAGDFVELVRNDDYYLGKPMIKTLLFKMIPDSNVELLALESGQVDSAGIPPKDYARIRAKKGINVFEYDAMLYVYMGMNLKSPVFSDINVRRALCYATNRKQLINLVFLGHASPAYAPDSPVSWAYSGNVNKYEYDPGKAKALLEASGWRRGGDKYLYRNGKRLEFTCLINYGNKEREKAAIILQQQYEKVGVKMNIRVLEWSSLLKIVNARKDPKDFDAVIIGWSLGIDPDSYSIWHSSEYPSGLNFIGYNNKKVDGLLEKGRLEQARDVRRAVYARMYELITRDAPYVFLWYPRSISGVNERVGGLSRPGPAGLFVHIEKAFVKK